MRGILFGKLAAAALGLMVMTGTSALAGGVGGTLNPGQPAGPDPFIITFDENGNGSVQHYNGTSYDAAIPEAGFLQGGFLTYRLPEFVGAGDVVIAEEGSDKPSDGIRFFNDGTSGLLQFYSIPGGGDVADTGFPSDFDYSFIGAHEVGENFEYLAGGGDPNTTNFYDGKSGGAAVPELSSLVGLGVLSGFGLLGMRRRKRA